MKPARSNEFARAARAPIALIALLVGLLPPGAATSTRSTSAAAASAAPANAPAAASAARALPGDSLYQFEIPLETADGRHTGFAKTSARARIVTFFYTSCPMVCPLTVETLVKLDGALTPAERAGLEILLVSMDPERDTPEALSQLARERHIPDKRWTLARASPSDTRKLAAALGIQYRRLSNGDFQHSSTLILLDGAGRAVARSSVLGTPAPQFVEAVRAALN